MFNKGWQPKEYKGVQDEIRQQHMKTKDMSLKEKLSYFWYYYKVHTFVIIIAVIAVCSYIYTMATAKDYIFYEIMLNSSQLNGDVLEASFGEYAGLDLENYECFIDTLSTLSYQSQSGYDMATFQKIIALIQSKDLDAMVLDAEVFYNFSFNGMMMDLRNVLSEEELARYEGNIYYIDYAEIRKAEEEEDTASLTQEDEDRNQATLEEISAEAETHKHPENMEEPVPVGIFADNAPLVQKTGCYNGLVPIYGIVITSQRTDTAKKYLDYIFDENIPFENMITVYY
ncbi:MAG: hypothetical protein ACI4ED_00655 [Suilimivivens sp.]